MARRRMARRRLARRIWRLARRRLGLARRGLARRMGRLARRRLGLASRGLVWRRMGLASRLGRRMGLARWRRPCWGRIRIRVPRLGLRRGLRVPQIRLRWLRLGLVASALKMGPRMRLALGAFSYPTRIEAQ